MEINRNQFFMIGLIILGIGVQLRMVDSYVLTPDATTFIAKHMKKRAKAANGQPAVIQPTEIAVASAMPIPTKRRTIHPPNWLGWSLLSIGSVLILHALALKSPDG